jgi:hypothetical protein
MRGEKRRRRRGGEEERRGGEGRRVRFLDRRPRARLS